MAREQLTLEWARQIGGQIRARRKEAGITLQQLSLLSGATVPTLSHIERGTRDVKLSTLVAIADALRAPLSELVTTPEPAPTEPAPPPPPVEGYNLGDHR